MEGGKEGAFLMIWYCTRQLFSFRQDLIRSSKSLPCQCYQEHSPFSQPSCFFSRQLWGTTEDDHQNASWCCPGLGKLISVSTWVWAHKYEAHKYELLSIGLSGWLSLLGNISGKRQQQKKAKFHSWLYRGEASFTAFPVCQISNTFAII